MMKTFAEALRDMINQYYAAGVSQEEIVHALAFAETPQLIEAAKAAGIDAVPFAQAVPVSSPTDNEAEMRYASGHIPESTGSELMENPQQVVAQLKGSDTLPDSYKIPGGDDLPQSVMCEHAYLLAFEKGAVTSRDSWNELPEAQRIDFIQQIVDTIPQE